MPFHFLRQDCLPQSNVRPSVCLLSAFLCICTYICLSHLSLLFFYYYCYYIVIIRHFVVHIRPSLFAWLLETRTYQETESHNQFLSGVLYLHAIRPPRPAVCHFVAGQIGPFLFTLSPPAREAPSSSHSLVAPGNTSPTRPLFFLPPPSSPLELSASLDLLAHRPNSRDLQPCWHLCTCG